MLATYVQEHIHADAESDRPGARPAPTPDVRAALIVLTHLERTRPPGGYLVIPDRTVDLRGLDLTGTIRLLVDSRMLTGANLSKAYLRDVRLDNFQAEEMDLSGADLSGASMSGAELSRADLSGARLVGTLLSGADMSGANLSNGSLSGADLNHADLKGANLRGADLAPMLAARTRKGAMWTATNLAGTDLGGADLREVKGMRADEIRNQALTDGDTRF